MHLQVLALLTIEKETNGAIRVLSRSVIGWHHTNPIIQTNLHCLTADTLGLIRHHHRLVQHISHACLRVKVEYTRYISVCLTKNRPSAGSASNYVPAVCNGREVVDSTTSSLWEIHSRPPSPKPQAQEFPLHLNNVSISQATYERSPAVNEVRSTLKLVV